MLTHLPETAKADWKSCSQMHMQQGHTQSKIPLWPHVWGNTTKVTCKYKLWGRGCGWVEMLHQASNRQKQWGDQKISESKDTLVLSSYGSTWGIDCEWRRHWRTTGNTGRGRHEDTIGECRDTRRQDWVFWSDQEDTCLSPVKKKRKKGTVSIENDTTQMNKKQADF